MQIPKLIIPETTYCAALDRMLIRGEFNAASEEEYEAALPFASNAPTIIKTSEETSKDDLVAKALALGVKGEDGKPIAKSTLRRWAEDRLKAAIAELEA